MSLTPLPMPTPDEAQYINSLNTFYVRLYRTYGANGILACSYYWASREKDDKGNSRWFGWADVDEYGRLFHARYHVDGACIDDAVPTMLARFLVFRDPRDGRACARPHRCDGCIRCKKLV